MAKQLTQQEGVTQIPVAGTVPSKFNARHDAGEISDLVVSVVLDGVIEPVIARPAGSGYEVIIGSRRLAAAKKAGLKTIPAIVKSMADDEALALSLVENIQRDNLSETDQAKGYNTLHGLNPKKWTQEAFAKRIQKNKFWVSRLLTAYSCMIQLQKAGVIKGMANYPTDEERVQDMAPITHLARIEETVNSMVKGGNITEKEALEKRVELAKAALPLPQAQAFKVIDRVKKAPERPVSEIMEEVQSGVGPLRPAESTWHSKTGRSDAGADDELMRKTSVETVLGLIEARTLYCPKHPKEGCSLAWSCGTPFV